MGRGFRDSSLDQLLLLAPSLQDWLPAGHLARFIAEVTELLNLGPILAVHDARDGRGRLGYHSLLLTRLLLSQAAGMIKLGVVAIDGTKGKANANSRRAATHEHIVEELGALSRRLLEQAEPMDAEEDGRSGKGGAWRRVAD